MWKGEAFTKKNLRRGTLSTNVRGGMLIRLKLVTLFLKIFTFENVVLHTCYIHYSVQVLHACTSVK